MDESRFRASTERSLRNAVVMRDEGIEPEARAFCEQRQRHRRPAPGTMCSDGPRASNALEIRNERCTTSTWRGAWRSRGRWGFECLGERLSCAGAHDALFASGSGHRTHARLAVRPI